MGLAEPGTEVVVKWGDHGGRIKDVRATVARYPYLISSETRATTSAPWPPALRDD